MTKAILAEIGFRRPGAGAAEVLGLTSRLGYAHPSSPRFYLPLIEQAADLDRRVFARDDDFGAGSMAEGELVANALGGELDFLIAEACGVYGHVSRLLSIDERDDYAAARPIFTGTMEAVDLTDETATFRWRDDIAKLIDTPMQSVKYDGTNALPAGIDGVEDIKGSWKPVLYGRRLNIPAICVNTSRYIYQVSSVSGHDVTAVYDRGAEIDRGAERASLSDLQSSTPTAGYYDWYAGADGVFFRLGSQPAGDVTCDAEEGATAADRTPGQVWSRILQARAGVGSGDILSADVTALDAAQDGECGVWCGGSDVSIRDALNEIAASASAVYFTRADGVWRIVRVTEPAGDPVASLITFRLSTAALPTDLDIGEIERLAPDSEAAVPACQVTIEYAPLGLVQGKDQTADVVDMTLERQQRLEREYLSVATDEDADVLTVHPNARRLTQQVTLLDSAAAVVEADHRAALFGSLRSRYRVVTQLTEAVPTIDLMDVVRVTYPRWELTGGKLFLVTGIRYDAAADTVELSLWG